MSTWRVTFVEGDVWELTDVSIDRVRDRCADVGVLLKAELL